MTTIQEGSGCAHGDELHIEHAGGEDSAHGSDVQCRAIGGERASPHRLRSWDPVLRRHVACGGTCRCNMWSPRERHATVVWENYMYLAGGVVHVEHLMCGEEACGGKYGE